MKNPKLEARYIEGRAAELGLAVAIETGTLHGETTRRLAMMLPFEFVYSIEASRELWRDAVARCFAEPIDGIPPERDPGDPGEVVVVEGTFGRIEFIHGDSVDELPKLCDIVRRPAFFYLDAHFCRDDERAARTEDHPLFAELAAIAARPFADLVWVDDVHTFGQDRGDLGQSWREITKESISDRLGRRVVSTCQVGDGYAIELRGGNEDGIESAV